MQNITFFGQTDVGKLRQNNEDDFIAQYIWDKNHVLGVVIDGLGGYEGGEIATKIAKETIIEHLEKPSKGEKLNLLKQVVVLANERIKKEQLKDDPKLWQMGCVLSTCLVDVEKQQINMVHVGDTRVYELCDDGELLKLSHDHSFVGQLEDTGELAGTEAMKHPDRNIIDRLLGHEYNISGEDYIQAETFPLLPNSTLLLCSDGLTDLVTKAEISAILN
ncbi:MAG: protein phosphatase 2C domain-containing protein, partial [Bacteroidales bacterium]|nr:protein phosphatase 2C domain-containing protein [Bacteroidales bacterium]